MTIKAYKAASATTKGAVAPGIVGSGGIIVVWVFGLFDVVVPADVGIAMAVLAVYGLNRAFSRM